MELARHLRFETRCHLRAMCKAQEKHKAMRRDTPALFHRSSPGLAPKLLGGTRNLNLAPGPRPESARNFMSAEDPGP